MLPVFLALFGTAHSCGDLCVPVANFCDETLCPRSSTSTCLHPICQSLPPLPPVSPPLPPQPQRPPPYPRIPQTSVIVSPLPPSLASPPSPSPPPLPTSPPPPSPSPPPPSPLPPSPLPPSPLPEIVQVELIVAGSVETFNQTAFIQKLSSVYNVPTSSVTLIVTSASVRVITRIAVSTVAEALLLEHHMSTTLANATIASQTLNMVVEEVTPVLSVSPPPPPPDQSSTFLIVVLVLGGVLLLACLLALAKKRPRAQTNDLADIKLVSRSRVPQRPIR